MDQNLAKRSLQSAPKINISAPKTNRLQYLKKCTTLEELFNKAAYQPHITNRDVALILRFHQFDKIPKADNLKQVESYCEDAFEELPLFLVYELSKEFKLKKLETRCRQEFIIQNFEQMNYSRMDLTKCSLDIFKFLLEEYRNLVLNLEIPGLQTKDLSVIVDDYCKINNISKETQERLEDEYVNCPLYDINPSRAEMRNSMIQTRNRKTSDVTSGSRIQTLRPEIRKTESSDCGDSSCSAPLQNSQNYCLVTDIHASLSNLNLQKQKLRLQMADTLKYCQQNKTSNEIDRLINKIDHKLVNISKKMSKSNKKLLAIGKIAEQLNRGHNKIEKKTENRAPPRMQIDIF